MTTWRTVRTAILILGLVVCCVMLDRITVGQEAPKPAEPNVAGHPNRSLQAIMADFEKSMQPLQSVFSPRVLTDPEKRKETAPKVIPVMKDSMKYLKELRENSDPQAKMIADQIQPQLELFLVVLGDDSTRQELETRAKADDHDRAAAAKGTLLIGDWILADKNAEKQKPMVDQAKQLAKDNPKSDQLTQLLFAMGNIGAASPELADSMQEVAASMQSTSAAQIKEQVESAKKLRALENKPLDIAGLKNDGKNFSTADWKGKVILVDFWATWCGPCREELPRVKKAYADFHDKGLEVLGVSCDNDQQSLNKFLSDNKDMPWPQLFDPKTPGWHPLAKQYGITGIPTMFLIDKKGIVRSVTARENFEEMIPKLLEEKS